MTEQPNGTMTEQPNGTMPAELADLLPGDGTAARPRLVEALRAEQARRWRAGQRRLAEDYLAAFPKLAASPDDALVLIWGEALLRWEVGEDPQPAEYQARFPQHAEALAMQFELQRQLETKTAASAPPREPAGASRPVPQWPGYEVLGELGRGGMGVVYKAREVSLDRVVALKMIRGGALASADLVERFHREARAAAALNHPHIVPVYASGQHGDHHFFTMACIEGANLKEVVRQDGLPSPRQAVDTLLAVAQAIAFAHEHGILHRDLKPENVLIDRHGWPRVTDFGLAKRVQEDAALTADGQLLGTPAYMAPEQARCEQDRIGPATDVYGLGAILYFLLTGQPPFQAESTSAVLCQVLLEKPAPPRQLNPRAPEELEAICLKCLEKDPALRYPSAAALAEALRDLTPRTDTDPRLQAPADTLSRPAPVTPEASPTLSAVSHTATPAPREKSALAGSPPAQPGRRSSLLWVGLACGLLLLATGAWLAIQQWPPHDPTPVAGPAMPGAAAPARGPTLLPERLRHDFGLDVEVVGGRPGAEGVRLLEEGDQVRFRIKAQRTAYVGVWTVEADGTILQLFPNAKEQKHLFQAGEERIVPQARLVGTLSRGIDRVLVEASTKPWSLAEGQEQGPFLLFQTERQRQWLTENLRGRRGLRFDTEAPSANALSEKVLPYLVQSRRGS